MLGNHSVVASDGQSIVRLDEVPVPRMRLCFVGEAKKPERSQPKFKPVWPLPLPEVIKTYQSNVNEIL